MAMSLPVVPASSDGQSPPSDDGSVSPQTPVSPPNAQPMALSQPSDSQNNSQPRSPSSSPTATQPKRKPSRRANTAERRATHNAVERQHSWQVPFPIPLLSDQFNLRFQDLAALLPNLSQIRRPSKSAIVNSSIAHIHASRRHRLLASRELRILKLESDALRRELNEWRDRAGLPRVDEPVRGDGFNMILSGEVEVLAAVVGEEEDEGQGQFDGFDEGDEELSGPVIMDDPEDAMVADPLVNSGVYGHNTTAGSMNSVDMKMSRMLPRAQPPSHPVIAQMPPSVSFENPAMPALYEPQITPHFQSAAHLGQHAIATPEADKVSPWTANMYPGYNAQLQFQAQRSMITPPNNAHAAAHSPSSAHAAGFTDYAYLANLKRQQLLALQHQHGVMAYAVDGDDASSVGSSQSGRERSGSASAGSGFGSPPRGPTSSGGYQVSNAVSDFTMARRIGNSGLHVNTAVSGSWSGRGEEGMNGMVMKQAMNSPMHVLPNSGGYGMMV
ncbi:hypothetical protein JVT61DRAFT_8989 [Boletus reticuloceps]|uniref:BHLH domain-containing protein n=1 Tax=Boletus reticuloceps TaxID=495285 RepID=A0A8I3A6G4_9AGAM|nr:hypothetical protein JVT61DRAFT_8989 [Boletus reticuloceps]